MARKRSHPPLAKRYRDLQGRYTADKRRAVGPVRRTTYQVVKALAPEIVKDQLRKASRKKENSLGVRHAAEVTRDFIIGGPGRVARKVYRITTGKHKY